MSDVIAKEILEIKCNLEHKRNAVAEKYVKRLASIIRSFGIYHTANTYRPRITLRGRLRFIYRPSDFLIEKRPFSGKWFQTGNLMIGEHRHYNQKGWYGATLTDYHVYEDRKEMLWVREVHCSDGWLFYRMKHLGHITPNLVQRLLSFNGQATQEQHKQREPEKQELEQQLMRLEIVDYEGIEK